VGAGSGDARFELLGRLARYAAPVEDEQQH